MRRNGWIGDCLKNGHIPFDEKTMKLRKLKKEDAPLMLEWMHDDSIVKDLRTDFSKKTLEDCLAFICMAQNSREDIHLAIANEQDEYLGTVSLKHIKNGTAEFGITIRKCVQGKGVASSAMTEILKRGFEQYLLQKIYWCVAPENNRALRFYDKNGYQRGVIPIEAQGYTEEEKNRYIWYQVLQ